MSAQELLETVKKGLNTAEYCVFCNTSNVKCLYSCIYFTVFSLVSALQTTQAPALNTLISFSIRSKVDAIKWNSIWTCQLSTKMVLHMTVRSKTQESSLVCSYCYELMTSWWCRVLIFSLGNKGNKGNKALRRSNNYRVGIRDVHHSLSRSVPIQGQRLIGQSTWQCQAPPEQF